MPGIHWAADVHRYVVQSHHTVLFGGALSWQNVSAGFYYWYVHTIYYVCLYVCTYIQCNVIWGVPGLYSTYSWLVINPHSVPISRTLY